MTTCKFLKIMFTTLFMIVGANACAIEIGGINYDLYSSTATVRKGAYSGDIVIPYTVVYEGKSYKVTRIGDVAFKNCNELTYVSIPESVTKIGHEVFYGCSNLSSIYIGNGMKSIADMAFGNCNSIKNVYCYATDVPSMTGAFNSTIANATLYVPAVSLNAYKSSWYWGKFGTIVPLTDEEVGIEQIDNGQLAMDNEPSTWYTLDGKKLNGKPAAKGIFIRNGRKLMVE